MFNWRQIKVKEEKWWDICCALQNFTQLPRSKIVLQLNILVNRTLWSKLLVPFLSFNCVPESIKTYLLVPLIQYKASIWELVTKSIGFPWKKKGCAAGGWFFPHYINWNKLKSTSATKLQTALIINEGNLSNCLVSYFEAFVIRPMVVIITSNTKMK